jgi:hypothetical protein
MLRLRALDDPRLEATLLQPAVPTPVRHAVAEDLAVEDPMATDTNNK